MEKSKLQQLTEIISDHEEHITPEQLETILTAVGLLKTNSGWGSITFTFLNSDLDKTEVYISQKVSSKKKNDV